MASVEKLDKDRSRRDLAGEKDASGEVFDLSAHRTRPRGGPKPKK